MELPQSFRQVKATESERDDIRSFIRKPGAAAKFLSWKSVI